MDRELLDYTLLSQGISIVPTVPGTKVPVRGFPLIEFFDGRRRATLSELTEWLKLGYDRAAIAGRRSAGLTILDFDSEEAFRIFFDKAPQDVADETFTVKTHRGYSVWVKDLTERLAPSSMNFRPILEAELLLSHHLVSCPLNTHPSGSLYDGPLGTEVIERKDGFASAVLDRMRSLGYVTNKHGAYAKEILEGVPLGERNSAAFRYARYLLLEIKLDKLAVLNELLRWNLMNSPPLPQREIETVVRSAIKYPKQKPRVSSRSYRKILRRKIEGYASLVCFRP
ncbi:MAG TPA: primase C-terminal domain-containing protein [Nitrososphaerales archaeon]|nr:primase C-terminal domain-containing protein [Nitrososphaerales archaeon]